MSEYADDFTELLGAYALDAVDADERARIEDHLRTCPWCSAEVAEHREVAALLSNSGTVAPPGVWDRIAAELSPEAPPLRLSVTPPAGAAGPSSGVEGGDDPSADPVVVPVWSARSVGRRTFAAVVATAACLLLVLGFVAVDQRAEADRMRSELAAPGSTVPPPGAGDIRVKLSGDDPRAGAQAVVTAEGQGILVSHDLPEVDDEQVFQLWGVVDQTVLSLGTFDHRSEVVNFQLDPKRLDGVSAFAITLEQAPGVVASEQDALLAGTI